jgi:LPS-assembly protein
VRQRKLTFLLLFSIGCCTGSNLLAVLPELSSIEPIEFNEKKQRLVARGDAQLSTGNTSLQADRITYYKEYGAAAAEGNVNLTHSNLEVLTQRLSFDLNEQSFYAENFRSGIEPYLITGDHVAGHLDELTFGNGQFYYGYPEQLFGIRIQSEKIDYLNQADNQSLRFHKPTLYIGSLPLLRLPSYTHHFGQRPHYFDIEGGQDSSLGTHLQTTTLFPLSDSMRAGLNFDAYSKRGILVGPTFQYNHRPSDYALEGALTTGYIKDQGPQQIDRLEETIDSNRYFLDWRHQQAVGEHVSITAKGTYWSDSEVTKDFRESLFLDDQQPDNFVEAVHNGNHYLLSVFTRYRPNDFHLIQERLPEVRFDWLPTPFFQTQAYHSFSANYVRLQADYSDLSAPADIASQSDRFELSYQIQRPIPLRHWLTLTPQLGWRTNHYVNQSLDADVQAAPIEDDVTRSLFELGFDLEARMYAHYPVNNYRWNINGLRHSLKPVLRYRYQQALQNNNSKIAQIDQTNFNLAPAQLDLNEMRNTDQIVDQHLMRIGIENHYQTRDEHYGSRSLAELNFYQELLFEKNRRYDNENQQTLESSWIQLALKPANWLQLDLNSRFRTRNLLLEELQGRVSLRSGDRWQMSLACTQLTQQINQYWLYCLYRLNERYSAISECRFNADNNTLDEATLGLRTQIGPTWEMLYAITINDASRLEDALELSIKIKVTQ